MRVDLKITKEKILAEGATGVIVMFGDSRYKYLYDKDLIMVDVMHALENYNDIEVYVVDSEYYKDLHTTLELYGKEYAKAIDEIKQFPEITGEQIVEKAKENIENNVERYGLKLSFETLIV